MRLKINQKSIDRLESDVKFKLKSVLENKQMLNEVGTLAVDMLKFSSRKGTSPVTGEKFKRLSKPWIKKRAKIAESTRIHPAYSKSRSNLTLTGQLMDAITHSVVGRTVRIVFDGFHEPYSIKTKKGISRVGKRIRNADLARFVAEAGRAFFGFGRVMEQKLLAQAKKIVIRYIRRNI
jgi:hypothetical protein